MYSNNSFSSNITKLDVSSEKINNSAIIVNNLSNSLLEKIDQIPILLNSIEEKTDATQLLISKLNFPNFTTQDNNFDPNEVDLEHFVYQNSTSGQTLLYILYQSLKNKKEFNLKKICNKYSLGYDYYYGFFVSVQTLKIVKTNVDYKNGEFFYEVSEMNSYVKENILKFIQDIKEKKDETYDSFKTNIKNIEDFFK